MQQHLLGDTAVRCQAEPVPGFTHGWSIPQGTRSPRHTSALKTEQGGGGKDQGARPPGCQASLLLAACAAVPAVSAPAPVTWDPSLRKCMHPHMADAPGLLRCPSMGPLHLGLSQASTCQVERLPRYQRVCFCGRGSQLGPMRTQPLPVTKGPTPREDRGPATVRARVCVPVCLSMCALVCTCIHIF